MRKARYREGEEELLPNSRGEAGADAGDVAPLSVVLGDVGVALPWRDGLGCGGLKGETAAARRAVPTARPPGEMGGRAPMEKGDADASARLTVMLGRGVPGLPGAPSVVPLPSSVPRTIAAGDVGTSWRA